MSPTLASRMIRPWTSRCAFSQPGNRCGFRRATRNLDAVRRAGMPVASACGADGSCARCGVRGSCCGSGSVSAETSKSHRVDGVNPASSPYLAVVCVHGDDSRATPDPGPPLANARAERADAMKKHTNREARFETRAIHAGQPPDAATGATIVPVYQTSTFTQDAIGQHKGYEYSRGSNPTRDAFEACLASLEGGRFGVAYASGMAAIAGLAQLLSAGDHVVVGDDLYGGSYRLFTHVLPRFGVRFTLGGCDPARGDRRRGLRRDEVPLDREPDEPHAAPGRHRGVRGDRATSRLPTRRRQHLRDALPPESARPRRPRRRPLDDEVPRRALRRDRRGAGRRRRGDGSTSCGSPGTPPAACRGPGMRGSRCAA